MSRTLWALLLLCIVAGTQGRSLLTEEDCTDDNKCGPKAPKSPKYKVIDTHGATEIREYANATWAFSFGRSMFGVDIAAAVATKGLFKYFVGGNNQHLRIPPSVPIVTTILRRPHPPPPHPHKNGTHPPHPHPHPHDDEESQEQPEFGDEDDFDRPHPPHHKNGSRPHPPGPRPPRPGPPLVLSGAFIPIESNIPKPDDRRVKLVKTNTTKVYAHEFRGWAVSWFVKREIKHLIVDLKDLGLKPCQGKFFVATYDGPWKIIGRRNEVWWAKLPKRPHHHHNHTVELSEEGLPFGFENIDPMVLFPEEVLPEDPKDTPVEHIDEPSEQEEALQGDWIDISGQSGDQVFETS